VSGSQSPRDAVMSYGCQGHGRDASTAFAIRIAPKLARGDARPEVRRNNAGGSRKDTFRRASRWGFNFTDEFFRHFQPSVFQPQLTQL
jgi:hypothetical protein